MILQPVRAVRRLLGFDIPGRRVEVRAEDRFVVSYPRSGNTWVRFLIANLLTEELVGFHNIERIVPDIYQNRTRDLRRLSDPRFLKSHEPSDPRYPRVLYVVRDPRDVCVSYFYYHRKMRWLGPKSSIDGFVHSFLRGDIRGEYGSWAMNVQSWLAAREGQGNFMLARYEDLLDHTPEILTEAARFLEIPTSNEAILAAIEKSSLEAMTKLEELESNTWHAIKGTDPAVKFVRGAGAGGWRRSLSPLAARLISEAWPDLISKLDYAP